MRCFEFTPIRRADFPLLNDWLSTAHVARWWHDDPSLDAIESDYGGCVDGTDPAEAFIARCDGAAVGLIQRYRNPIDSRAHYIYRRACDAQDSPPV